MRRAAATAGTVASGKLVHLAVARIDALEPDAADRGRCLAVDEPVEGAHILVVVLHAVGGDR